MRVIIRLHLREPFAPEEELTDEGITHQRVLIQGAQQRLTQALTGYTYTLTLESPDTPIMSLDVPPETLAQLEALIGVVIESVTPDELAGPSEFPDIPAPAAAGMTSTGKFSVTWILVGGAAAWLLAKKTTR